MIKFNHQEKQIMAKVNKDEGVDFDALGIGSMQEPDRDELDARGPFQITRIRFDYKTKYWNDETKTGTPITKFDGVDPSTGENKKYRTLSSVIYKSMAEILVAVGATVQKDENGDEWSILKKPVNVGGFEKVSTGIKGRNPYIKIVPNHK